MVKPNADGQMQPAIAHAIDIESAGRVADRLARGDGVQPQELDRARQAFIDGLWHGIPEVIGDSATRLLRLFTGDRHARLHGELLGQALAVGSGARQLLDQLLRGDDRSVLARAFKPDERAALTGVLGESIGRRLNLLTEWLGAERARPGFFAPPVGEHTPDPTRTPTERQRLPVDRAPRLPELPLPDKRGREDGPDGGDGDDDSPLSDAARLAGAVQEGATAIPRLRKMLDTADRELATVALVHLGRGGSAREVHELATRLELDRRSRHLGEFLRRAIVRGDSPSAVDRGARERATNAALGDKWLSRALNSFDATNIMSAAAGREVIVLPLVAGPLVSVRIPNTP